MRGAALNRREPPALPAGKLAPPLPQHPACQVFVNHLYRVVYLRFAKAASTSLLCHFGGCSANATDPSQKGLGFKLLQARRRRGAARGSGLVRAAGLHMPPCMCMAPAPLRQPSACLPA